MKKLFALLLAAALLLALAGCQKDLPEPTDTLVAAMDTQMNLRLYGDTDNTAAKALTAEILRLHAELSVTEENSTLFRLNRFKVLQNAEIAALLTEADRLNQRTGGALDVTLLPMSRLWGFIGDAYYVPSGEELKQTLSRTGADKYNVSEDTVTLLGDAELDFGALAKGYAADRCRAYLEPLGIPALLSLGGNIQSVGTKPDGTPWLIGIQDPQALDNALLTLSVTGTKSVVTSGDYQRYFDLDGVHYCHIIDPKTGSPVQNTLRSVTVVTDSGLLADGLSTALFVMGLEDACAHWRSSNDFEAVFIDTDGTVYVTAGLSEAVSGCEFTVIER